jgi:hypothetical protein
METEGCCYGNGTLPRDVATSNAVVGVRYDATEVMQGVTEVLCYGTAVVVEPARS